MMRSLLILGCGGHGRVVADTARNCGYEQIAFLDDVRSAEAYVEAKVLGALDSAGDFVEKWPAAIVAIGDSALRLQLFKKLRCLSFRTPSIVHPTAVISRGAFIGEGVFVAAGAIINTGARIDDAAIVNTGATIDHDCHIGAGSHVAPGSILSGNVIVGMRSWLGTGSAVRQGVKIGDDVVVGVGAAVVSDLAPKTTYVGVPARPMKNRADT